MSADQLEPVNLKAEFQYTAAELREAINERTDRKWEAFCEFVPTPNLFLLFTTKTVAVVVPKRAFSAPDRALFQQLAQREIHPRISAFPVVSPDPRPHL